ncbi:hypothetical protein ACP4OV_025482 [Aristida adscensionis]
MASPSSSQQAVKLILAASNGRPITAYDALTGKVVAEFPASSTPRHGLAVVTGPDAPARIAASHVCPDTGAASIHLLPWRPPRAGALAARPGARRDARGGAGRHPPPRRRHFRQRAHRRDRGRRRRHLPLPRPQRRRRRDLLPRAC